MENERKEWPWWLGGIVLGLATVFTFVAAGRQVGAATSYERVAANILGFFFPDYVANNVHFMKEALPVAEFQVWFLIGMIISGLVGRYFFTKKKGDQVPAMWVRHFGDNKGKRYLQAFIGGFIMLFGARLAGGCTSGLFISGTSQLALAALVFAGGFFASGIITAKILYKGRNV